MYYKDGKTYGSTKSIRNELKHMSLPVFMSDEFIKSLGYLLIVDAPKPDRTEVQRVEENGILMIGGVPTRQWKVVDMFSDTEEYTDIDGTVISSKTKAEHEAEYMAMLAKEAEAIAKAERLKQLEVLTVTTTNGNTFDANNQARLDMSNGIQVSEILNVTQTVWRMADDSEVLIQIAELKEALALSLQAYATLKGIG